MPILTMLIGIQGSGKSTWAKFHKGSIDNTVIISTDEIRNELFGGYKDNDKGKVFNEVYKRVKSNLENDTNVILDSTNLNSKKRKNFLKTLKGIKDLQTEAIFFPTELYTCLNRNYKRESHVVPIEKINESFLSCQVPMYHEGWNNITYMAEVSPLNKEELYDELYDLSYSKFKKEILFEVDENNIELPQDNPHHTLSVSRHMYVAYQELLKETEHLDFKEGQDISEGLKLATLLHDVGKAYCKRFKEGSKYATFHSHENVSAYLTTVYMIRRGYSDRDITYVTSLIQLHTKFFDIKTEDQFLDLVKMLGTDMYNELYLLNKMDKLAK